MNKRLAALPLLLLSLALPAAAGVRLPVQGELLDSGAPVAGPVDLDFTIEDQAGTALTCERFTSVALSAGVFRLILGDTANDCGGGLPTEIDELFFFQAQGHQLIVTFNGNDLSFPLAEAPRAGVSVFAEVAATLNGLELDRVVPNGVVRVSEGADVAAALAEAGASGVANPVVELGPGAFTLDNVVIAEGVTLRGAGAGRTRVTVAGVGISGGVHVESMTLLSGVGPALLVRSANGQIDRTVVEGVHFEAIAPAGQQAVVLDLQQGEGSDLVIVRDCEARVVGPGGGFGIVDQVGQTVRVSRTRMDISADNFAIGFRVGNDFTNLVPNATLDVRDSEVFVSGAQVGFIAGVEIIVAPGAGTVRIRHSTLAVSGPDSGAIQASANGDVRVEHSVLRGDRILNSNGGAPGTFRFAHTAADPQIEFFVTGEVPPACLFSYDEDTGAELPALCK